MPKRISTTPPDSPVLWRPGLILAPFSRYLLPIALFLGPAAQVSLLWAQSLDFAPPGPDGPPKIQSSLWELATADPAAKPVAPPGLADVQEPVVVVLVPHHGEGSASIDTTSLASLGATVLATSRSLMRVSVPPSSLVDVSELPGVSFVRRPYRPHPQEIWSEGGALTGAYDNYHTGVRGQGVKVAIIDAGFKGADQLSGDMPARWESHDYTEEGMYAGDIVHGTASAEVVHDMAQRAELTLLKVGDLVDLENAKDRCIRDGVHIISHALSWVHTGFGDGRGLACDIVNDAAENGMLWLDSAGNFAKGNHYLGYWSDSNSNQWHDFAVPLGELLTFQAEEGDPIDVTLTWDDFPSTEENYDLYLFFIDTSGNLASVDSSITIQDGIEPAEWIIRAAEKPGSYGVAVLKDAAAESKEFKIWSANHEFERYAVSENSIGSPADAVGSMGIGAIHPWDWEAGEIADYSSRGPTTDGRVKPDLAAPSGVSTASYGKGGFFGTSAALPHVAGAAALIKSANPSYSRDDLWNALIAATVDIDALGRDNNTGYGKLVLPVMGRQDVIAPQISSVSPTRARYHQVIAITGTGFGSVRASGRVVFHGGTEPSSSQYLNWSDTQIQVRVPTGAQTGDLQVITATGIDSARLTITSAWIGSVSPRSGRTNTLVTVTGGNFGATRGTSSVRIGSQTISSYASWSSSSIRFRIPVNAHSGNLTVRTSEGTSNHVSLEVTSPYLTWTSPTRVKTGDRLTLTGGNFGSNRGSGYVLFTSNVRPSSGDYVTWSDRRIIVEVPDRTRSGDVKVVTSHGSSGTRRIEVEAVEGPRVTSVSPTRVRYNQILTIRGTGFGATRGAGKVVFLGGTEPRSHQYVNWSSTRIQVRVPTGARTGNLQVVTEKGRASFRLTVTSPWVQSISPRSGRTNTLVTVTGSNFGAARGNSSVRIGGTPVSSYSSWSNTAIDLRIPVNARPGGLAVWTSEGRSNSIHLEVTSPYLTRISPSRVFPGDLLTLTGGNFGSTRGLGRVLFTPNVRPSIYQYQSWSASRIVVEVPDRAETGDVKVVTSLGSSGTRRIEVEAEALPLPSSEIHGYSPPALTEQPKSVKFGFEGIGHDLALTWSLKSDGEVTLHLNNQHSWRISESEEWQVWWILLNSSMLNSHGNLVEFRNVDNQSRTSNYTHWQLKDVKLWKPFEAKPPAGAKLLSPSLPLVEAGLGNPFPAPFNAEVTVPFTTTAPGQVRMAVYNLAGQRVRLLHDAWVEAGSHESHWDGRTDSGRDAGSGVYCVLLQAPTFTQSARLVLIR